MNRNEILDGSGYTGLENKLVRGVETLISTINVNPAEDRKIAQTVQKNVLVKSLYLDYVHGRRRGHPIG